MYTTSRMERFLQDPTSASPIEWLEVNGRGGYASGTASLAPTRRYHALLLVARHPPHDRMVLVNHLVETLATQDQTVRLTADPGDDRAPGDDRPPHLLARSFAARPVAQWTFEAPGFRLSRWLLCPRGRDVVIVRWLLERAPGNAATLRIRPMLTGRADHEVASASDAIDDGFASAPGLVSWRPHADFPRVTASSAATYRHEPTWRHAVEYPVDRARGEPWQEDWWSPGELALGLVVGEPRTIAFAADHDEALDGEALFLAELSRREPRHPAVRASGSALFDELRVSAESYLVDVSPGDGAALLAGFPWFEAWTRDTFTAFSGLVLATKRFEEARRILLTFAQTFDGGMLPNSLPTPGSETRWNAADASFWFVISVGRYLEHTGDLETVRQIWPSVSGVIAGTCRGPSHAGIGLDDDGLVHAAGDEPLTWMDAQYQGRVFTPRRGKPVEIQALWAAALDAARGMAERLGDDGFARQCRDLRARTVTGFHERYWYETGGHLRDVVDGPSGDDTSLRPNQLFALALCDDLVSPEQGKRVLEVVRARLLTPLGLRTLASDDPRYRARYEGPRADRDAAYHQGTVWPFLLGPFVAAWVRVHGASEETRREALGFLRGVEQYLLEGASPGHLCEIFDAEPPHAPRGCFAQAWSAGELLYSLSRYVLRDDVVTSEPDGIP